MMEVYEDKQLTINGYLSWLELVGLLETRLILIRPALLYQIQLTALLNDHKSHLYDKIMEHNNG